MTEPKSNNLRWWILFTVIIGTFLGRLDQTIVNLALPKIIDDFGISVTAAGWIATAYILANAIFVPIWGKLGDTIGRKKVYVLGFSLFIVGSVLAGLAWNLPSMIVFRVIQAIAGSADYPTAMAILAITFKAGKERGQALGIWSSSFAAASVFGPLIGGPLIDLFGWRSIFLLNLPIGLIGTFMALRFINESKAPTRPKYFDWWGAGVLSVCLSAVVLVLDKGADWGWNSTGALITYALAVISLYIFVRIEQRVPEPLVDLKFFKIPAFVNTLMNNFVIFMGMMGGIFLIPIFAQTFLGYDATQSGYLFIPMAAALMLAAPLGPALGERFQARFIIFWSTMIAGFGIYLLSYLEPKSGAWAIMIPLCIMAFGMGFGMAQRTNIIASVVDHDEIGVASSVLALVRNVAGALGIALFGTVLTSRTEWNILKINSLSTLSSHVPLDVQKFVSLITLKAQIDAYDFVFLLASIFILVGGFAILWLKVDTRKGVTVHVE